MNSPLDPNLHGGVVLTPPEVCAECGSPGQTDEPLWESPWGWLCLICAEAKAVSILTAKPNRAERRRRFKAEGQKGDRNRKRKRR